MTQFAIFDAIAKSRCFITFVFWGLYPDNKVEWHRLCFFALWRRITSETSQCFEWAADWFRSV